MNAIKARSNRLQRVQVASYESVPFGLAGTLWFDPRHRSEAVERAVQAALLGAFCFHERAFGQAVAASQVISVLQAVPGVVAVDLDGLFYDPPRGTVGFLSLLQAATARLDSGQVAPAQLLLLEDAGSIDLEMEVAV